MGLVDRDQHRLALGEHLGEAGDGEALGSDEQVVDPPRQIVDADLPRGRPVPSRVDALGAEAELAELADLVLHERDQRRDDQRGAAAGEAWKLITERFPRSRGHDEEDVPSLHHGPADRLLIGAERGEAEGGVEEEVEVSCRTLTPRPPLPSPLTLPHRERGRRKRRGEGEGGRLRAHRLASSRTVAISVRVSPSSGEGMTGEGARG